MSKKRNRKLTVKGYVVAIPVPWLDRRGRKLGPARVNRWVRLTELELTDCFGGATPILSSGTNIVGGKILYEKGQTLVYSACDHRNDFLEKRARIRAFVERMGRELDQKSVFLLACPSDSFLIEFETGSKGKRYQ